MKFTKPHIHYMTSSTSTIQLTVGQYQNVIQQAQEPPPPFYLKNKIVGRAENQKGDVINIHFKKTNVKNLDIFA